jgi:hypothetical protein
MRMIDDLRDGVVGIEAHGKVTGEDYETVLIPVVERALQAHRKIRFLYRIAPDFTGFTGTALWDDARLGMRHLGEWELKHPLILADHSRPKTARRSSCSRQGSPSAPSSRPAASRGRVA